MNDAKEKVPTFTESRFKSVPEDSIRIDDAINTTTDQMEDKKESPNKRLPETLHSSPRKKRNRKK